MDDSVYIKKMGCTNKVKKQTKKNTNHHNIISKALRKFLIAQ